jgi:mRNA interferase RelE/StbE
MRRASPNLAPGWSARRAKEKIQALAQDPRPHGCLKLKGEDNLWRIRVGDWRVIYEIHDRVLVVVVVDVDHRGDVDR